MRSISLGLVSMAVASVQRGDLHPADVTLAQAVELAPGGEIAAETRQLARVRKDVPPESAITGRCEASVAAVHQANAMGELGELDLFLIEPVRRPGAGDALDRDVGAAAPRRDGGRVSGHQGAGLDLGEGVLGVALV